MNEHRIEDPIRIIRNRYKTIDMNTYDEIEHRYEQRGAEYTLRSWRDREMSVTASMVERPEWLVKIIDLAVVGGHVQTIPHPPPDLIVWFRTTKDSNELLEFVDFSRTVPSGTFQSEL